MLSNSIIKRFRFLGIMLILTLYTLPICCGGNGDGDDNGDDQSRISIDLEPSKAAVMVNASFTFQVNVQGTENSDLTWYVNDQEGGSSELGVIQNGIYTAPPVLPPTPNVIIRCQSNVEPDVKANANILITSPWMQTYGGINDDEFLTVCTLPENDYILAGDTASFVGGIRSSWLIKLTQDGSRNWEKIYGRNEGDDFFSTRAMLLGNSEIVSAARIFQSEEGPVWKLTKDGSVMWSLTNKDTEIHSSGRLSSFEIKPTVDGGLVIATGYGYNSVGDLYNKAYIWKLNFNGRIEWRSIFKGNRPTGNYIDQDGAYSIEQTIDGGYIVAGWLGVSSLSWNEQKNCFLIYGHFCPAPPQYSGLWLTKLRSDGSPIWSKRFQTSTPSYAVVRHIPSGGLILLAQIADIGSGSLDFWILKIDENGTPLWQCTYGGSADDLGYDIKPTSNGGFIVVGETQSFGYGESDALVLKLRGDGSVEWTKTYGGIGTDQVLTVEPSVDGGFILAGRTNSFGEGGQDAWVLKIDPYGGIGDNCPLVVSEPDIIAQPTTVAHDDITVSFEISSDDLIETTLYAEPIQNSIHHLCGSR